MAIRNAADNSFKTIFGDHQIFSEFIKDFIDIDILSDIKPEDIEDVSERFLPLNREGRDADTVKLIRLKDNIPLFVIAILEHESQVDFRASFKMFQYIYLVLDAWEKENEKVDKDSSILKNFKYPPVLPIIFYDGKGAWTAEKNFLYRTHLSGIFEKYIPKFEYELVNLNDYTEKEIMKFADVLSFILLIDKLRDTKGEKLLSRLPKDYAEKINLIIPDNLRKMLSRVIRTLLEKSEVDQKEIDKIASVAEKNGEVGIMFEAVIESILEGRKEARAEGCNEGIEATARNALAKGFSVEVVHDITGLNMETIQRLKKQVLIRKR